MNVDKQRKGFRAWGHGVREPVNKLLSFLVVFNFGRLSTLPPASASNTSKPDIDLLCCFPAIAEESNVIMSQAIPKSGHIFSFWHFFRQANARHWGQKTVSEVTRNTIQPLVDCANPTCDKRSAQGLWHRSIKPGSSPEGKNTPACLSWLSYFNYFNGQLGILSWRHSFRTPPTNYSQLSI